MAKGVWSEFESACHNYCCSVLFSSPSKGSFGPRPQPTPSFWPCVSVKRSMAHFGGTNKRRTHSFSQTIISNCTQILNAPTHIRSLALFICVEISHLCGDPTPLPPLLILLNQSINVDQMALMCSESLAKSSNSRGHNNGFGRGLEGVLYGSSGT